MDVEGPLVGKNALKYSEAGELMLDNTVHWYDILFTEGTSVNRVKAKFKNTDNVRHFLKILEEVIWKLVHLTKTLNLEVKVTRLLHRNSKRWLKINKHFQATKAALV